MDPHLAGDTTSAGIIVEVFGGLVTIDKDLKIAPDLAEDWDVTNGGRTYTFHLRNNATFHDGREVTAQDVKWSIERAGNPATQAPTVDLFLGDIVGFKDKANGIASDVSGVRVIDDQTIEITADAPKAYFLAKLTYPTSFVLDKNNVTGDATWLRSPNGTGPFRLAEYTPGEVIRLTAFEGYHLGAPHLAEVLHILSGGDALLMYENDEIHVTGVGLTNLDAILDPANPLNRDVNQAPPSFSTYYMGMNVAEPPFDDPKVRLALNYAIDRDTISTTLLKGLLAPANSVLPPGFPGYQESIGEYDFDPEKAQRLLSESKYGANMDNFPDITLSLPGSFGSSISSSTEAILAMWQQTLGIEVDVLQTEWATYLQDQRAGRFQMYGGAGWVADYPDPENFLDILLHSKSSNNRQRDIEDHFDDNMPREVDVEEVEQVGKYVMVRGLMDVEDYLAPDRPLSLRVRARSTPTPNPTVVRATVAPPATVAPRPATAVPVAPSAVPAVKPTATPTFGTRPAGTINYGVVETGIFEGHPRFISSPRYQYVAVTAGEAMVTINPDLSPGPYLATEWSIAPDFLTWTWKIRDDVEFQKGYGNLTIEDVLYSFQQYHEGALNARSGIIGAYWTGKTGGSQTIIDDYTVEVNTGEPWIPERAFEFMRGLGGLSTSIVSKKQSDELTAEVASKDIAMTGPWEIKEFSNGNFWRFEAVQDHWRQTPFFDELVLWTIPEESARVAGFQVGVLDIFQMSFDTIPIVEAMEGATIVSWPNAGSGRLEHLRPDLRDRQGWQSLRQAGL